MTIPCRRRVKFCTPRPILGVLKPLWYQMVRERAAARLIPQILRTGYLPIVLPAAVAWSTFATPLKPGRITVRTPFVLNTRARSSMCLSLNRCLVGLPSYYIWYFSVRPLCCVNLSLLRRPLLASRWEFFTTLGYEFDIIRGVRHYRWTIWVRGGRQTLCSHLPPSALSLISRLGRLTQLHAWPHFCSQYLICSP
jgi:hypothetical protein